MYIVPVYHELDMISFKKPKVVNAQGYCWLVIKRCLPFHSSSSRRTWQKTIGFPIHNLMIYGGRLAAQPNPYDFLATSYISVIWIRDINLGPKPVYWCGKEAVGCGDDLRTCQSQKCQNDKNIPLYYIYIICVRISSIMVGMYLG